MTVELSVGARLRAARRERGMTLRQMSQEVGVSPSLLSQIETGKIRPSVAVLISLASMLSTTVDELLGLETEPPPTVVQDVQVVDFDIQRAAENPTIEMENGVRWERLAMGRHGPAEALLVTYEPGATGSVEGRLMRHTGVEYVYVVEGVFTFQLEFDTYELHPGDSLRFNSSRPHVFSNRGSARARGVWFTIGRNGEGVFDFKSSPARSVFGALQRADSVGPSAQGVIES